MKVLDLFCGAGYQELPQDENLCQECGSPDSLIKRTVYLYETDGIDYYSLYPCLFGSKGQITVLKPKYKRV